jgi:hemin uptake protein HemP
MADHDQVPHTQAGGDREPGPRRIFSAALFRDDREVVIIHRGQEYRLRITKAEKLILTK